MTFTVEPDTGRVVSKADGKLLTACKFKSLPLTAKEVVWAYSQRQLPVGIMLLDPDRQAHKFALNNLDKYDESEEERKVFMSKPRFRLAWAYWPDKRPVLVELAEYRVTTSLIKLSPLNWRYGEFGRDKDELTRFQRTKRELHNTNLRENTYWEVLTDTLRLVRDVRSISFGGWVRTARHSQTYSHQDREVTIHQPSEVKVRTARPNKKLGNYAQGRITESREVVTSQAQKMIEKQQRTARRKLKDSPLLKYTEEVLFPSHAREEFDMEMARWISDNSI